MIIIQTKKSINQYPRRYKVKEMKVHPGWTFFNKSVEYAKIHFMAEKAYVDIHNARSQEYRQKLEKILEQGVDPFDKIFLGQFDEKEILYETEHWFAFLNQHQYPGTQYQFVIVTQKYMEHFEELPIGAITDLFALAQKICHEYDIPGGGLTMRFGDTVFSGATVKHLHAQLIVPEKGKKVCVWFGSENK